MLNIIFSILNISFSEDQIEFFRKNYNFVLELPESIVVNEHILCQGNVKNIEELEIIKAQLSSLGALPEIIGVWNIESGLRYGYKYDITYDDDDNIITKIIIRDLDIEIIYPFNITDYTNYLQDIKEYDEYGNLISSTRPTEMEARNIQVNIFSGMQPRNLGV